MIERSGGDSGSRPPGPDPEQRAKPSRSSDNAFAECEWLARRERQAKTSEVAADHSVTSPAVKRATVAPQDGSEDTEQSAVFCGTFSHTEESCGSVTVTPDASISPSSIEPGNGCSTDVTTHTTRLSDTTAAEVFGFASSGAGTSLPSSNTSDRDLLAPQSTASTTRTAIDQAMCGGPHAASSSTIAGAIRPWLPMPESSNTMASETTPPAGARGSGCTRQRSCDASHEGGRSSVSSHAEEGCGTLTSEGARTVGRGACTARACPLSPAEAPESRHSDQDVGGVAQATFSSEVAAPSTDVSGVSTPWASTPEAQSIHDAWWERHGGRGR